VPAKLKKLRLFNFGGSFKNPALSGVRNSHYRQFSKVLAKCQENHFEAIWQNARKIILRQLSKMPGKSF
jgi:hypothetical protein